MPLAFVGVVWFGSSPAARATVAGVASATSRTPQAAAFFGFV